MCVPACRCEVNLSIGHYVKILAKIVEKLDDDCYHLAHLFEYQRKWFTYSAGMAGAT